MGAAPVRKDTNSTPDYCVHHLDHSFWTRIDGKNSNCYGLDNRPGNFSALVQHINSLGIWLLSRLINNWVWIKIGQNEIIEIINTVSFLDGGKSSKETNSTYPSLTTFLCIPYSRFQIPDSSILYRASSHNDIPIGEQPLRVPRWTTATDLQLYP